MENRAHALAAGIFVLLLGLASALGLWWLGGLRAEKADFYLIETARDVTGLNLQAQVRYRGIRAGKVESIDADAKDRRLILIRISLDRKYPVTTKTVARMGYQGLTGLAYIQLEDDGSSEERLEAKGGELPRIGMKASLFESLTERGGDIASQLSEVAKRMSALMNEKNMQNLSRTVENVATASEGLKELPKVIAAMREMLSDANIKRMNALLAHLEKAAGEAAPLTAEVREMVKTMTALSQRLDQVAGEAGADTLPRVNALLRDLQTSSRQMTRILEMVDDSPQAFIFGRGPAAPGPGEPGFGAAATAPR
ncbi:MlaD family protein [Sulfurisoma sediminicola]|uniref:Phospholipid/cholesterol/gamma-HCH transport system substrate-binding protein n=1 Tax=Sulfurisoma sediminicola TaxID=1381557 RepID=A0A497XDS7_9PROT|nr:MlaD family protein [Sulfurisoma sediminicola]RLJ65162.1 phospholipid/cholesterol/gamma-HCH transport system substrate-binding protein [Sulfurisoma sediminicola]